MSGGGQTTTQRVEPFPAQKTALTTGFDEASRLFQQGALAPPIFPGNTFVPISPERQAGLSGLTSLGLGGLPFSEGALNLGGATIGGEFLGSNPVNPLLGSLAAGQGVGGSTTPFLSGAAQGGLLGANPASNFLTPIAAGGGLANPALAGFQQFGPAGGGLSGAAGGALDVALDRLGEEFRRSTVPGLQSAFSLAGRGGSPAEFDALSRANQQFGDIGGDIVAQFANQDLNRQLAANQALGSQFLSGLGLQAGAAGQLGGVFGQDIGQALQAAGQFGGLRQNDIAQQLQAAGQIGSAFGQERGFQQQALFGAPELNQLATQPFELLQNVGLQREAFQGQQLQDAISRFLAEGGAPAANLQNFLNLVGNFNLGQTTTQSAQNKLGPLGVIGTLANIGGLFL